MLDRGCIGPTLSPSGGGANILGALSKGRPVDTREMCAAAAQGGFAAIVGAAASKLPGAVDLGAEAVGAAAGVALLWAEWFVGEVTTRLLQ